MNARALRTIQALAIAGVIAIGAGGCTQELPGSTPLAEAKAKAGGDFKKAQAAGREAGKGIFTDAESDCTLDKVFSRTDITLDQLKAYNDNPSAEGPVQAAYQQDIPACLDPNAVVTGEPSAEVKTGLVKGFESAGLTEAQGQCVLDHLKDQGLTVRTVVLAGYKPEVAQANGEKIAAVINGCKA